MRAIKVILGTVVISGGAMAGTWAAGDGWPSRVVYGAGPEQERGAGDLDRGLSTILRSAGFTDPRAKRKNLCRLVPPTVPSGLPVALQGCQ